MWKDIGEGLDVVQRVLHDPNMVDPSKLINSVFGDKSSVKFSTINQDHIRRHTQTDDTPKEKLIVTEFRDDEIYDC